MHLQIQCQRTYLKLEIEIELKVQAFLPLSILFNETKNTQKKIDFIFIFSFLRSAAFFFNASL